MSSSNNFDFDFNFEGTDRAALLSEMSALYSELSGEEPSPDAATDPASRLLVQLEQEIAEFGTYPDVLKLSETDFTNRGLTVPTRFRNLSEQYKFYWLRFPVTFHLPSNWYFNKLECAVEFNPETTDGHLRPRACMILPDRKFQKQLEFSDGIELRIGDNFEFEATSGDISIQAGQAQTTAKASVEAKAASNLGLLAGPFTYSLKKAKVTHNDPGDSRVFWRIDGAEFFQENSPTLIVILQVPKVVEQVKIAAALQAYHHPDFWNAELGDVMRFVKEKTRTFFRKGTPLRHTKPWDITPSL